METHDGVDGVSDLPVRTDDFVVLGLRKLLRQELANPGARRKQGPVVLRDPKDHSVVVNLDDLVPGHLGGYKAPLMRMEYRDGRREKKIGGIDESRLMIAKLRAALLAVSKKSS